MNKNVIYRAGVIPFMVEDGKIQMMFMKPSKAKYGGDVFQIAKGKREDGESNEEAAFREAGEELGLFSGNVVHRQDLGTFLGRTRIYLAEIADKDMFGDPDDETGETKWMSPSDFYNIGRKLHKPIIQAAERWILNNREVEDNNDNKENMGDAV